MSEAPKRKGIRLPWLADEEEAISDEAAAQQNGTAPAERVDIVEPAPEMMAPAIEAAPSEASGPFLQSMVDAMRRIAEQARDDAMAKLTGSIEERSAELRSNADLRAAELRDQADADVARIGELEQQEIQRVRDDAAAKVADRQRQLDAQLQANTAGVEGAMSSVASQIEAFEQRMATFFADLADVHDPAAFAAAVKKMPSPPLLDEKATVQPVRAVTSARVAPSWPAEPEMRVAPAEAVEVEPVEAPPETPITEPAAELTSAAELAAAVEPAATEPAVPPVEAAVEQTGPDATTQIMVSGLNSFGAITQFKQSLEKATGIRRVALGLGSSGEFVFTATHAEGFDPTSAIRSFESSAQFRVEDGQLKVSVGASS